MATSRRRLKLSFKRTTTWQGPLPNPSPVDGLPAQVSTLYISRPGPFSRFSSSISCCMYVCNRNFSALFLSPTSAGPRTKNTAASCMASGHKLPQPIVSSGADSGTATPPTCLRGPNCAWTPLMIADAILVSGPQDFDQQLSRDMIGRDMGRKRQGWREPLVSRRRALLLGNPSRNLHLRMPKQRQFKTFIFFFSGFL